MEDIPKYLNVYLLANMAYNTDKKMELPKGFIDLGEKLEMAEIIPSAPKETSYHYPSLYFTDAKGMESLPEKGTAKIYFKKVMERKESVSTENGTEKRYSVELQICGIKPEESDPVVEDMEDPEDALERELAKYESGEEEEGEEDEESSSKVKIEIGGD